MSHPVDLKFNFVHDLFLYHAIVTCSVPFREEYGAHSAGIHDLLVEENKFSIRLVENPKGTFNFALTSSPGRDFIDALKAAFIVAYNTTHPY